MDRWGWLQRECSKRPPNRRLPGAASGRRNESAQREIALFSNKENRKKSALVCCPTSQLLRCGGGIGPVPTNLAASRHRLRIDTSSCRTVPLADLANTIRCYARPHETEKRRDVAAAKRFFSRATKQHGAPRVITLDGYAASHRAVAKLKPPESYRSAYKCDLASI